MKNQIQIDSANYAVRWVSYLDLLGFAELVKTKNWIYIFSHYTQAVERFIKDFGFEPKIEKTWFSDTFLLYSPDNTASSFAAIEAINRWFIYFLISYGIPARGAMSCGNFYADKGNNVFFGQSLIEAHYYGENQDWIGFVLSPSAVNQMAAVGLPVNERLNYAYWQIPYKKADDTLAKFLPAYIIGNSVEINGRNPCLDKLIKMKERLNDSRLIRKYENTISFIKANKRIVIKD
jgi:hypothetical protein